VTEEGQVYELLTNTQRLPKKSELVINKTKTPFTVSMAQKIYSSGLNGKSKKEEIFEFFVIKFKFNFKFITHTT
jgi:cytochrome c-type biogenesis protein CcmH/NrfF